MIQLDKAEFGIGEIIYHKNSNYRGVIIDVDPNFQGTEVWYQKNVEETTPKNEPWYHILIDQQDTIAYVAQKNLERDGNEHSIEHPLIENFFLGKQDGVYKHRQSIN